jgi:carbonic anhydrase
MGSEKYTLTISGVTCMSNVPPHTAKAIVVTCMDERLEPAISALIHGLPGGAFHVALAGGGAAFTWESDQAVALKQVVAAYKINHIHDVYLQSHTNCGAYGLAGITFSTEIEEAERLYSDLDAAAHTVQQALYQAGAKEGEITVHTMVIDATGQPVDRPATTP